MKKLILSILVIVLAACSFGAKSEMDTNRQKWQNANIPHYHFNLFVGCFCAFTQHMPLTIEVKDGQVLSMTYRDGTPVSENERGIFKEYETIDDLFNFTGQQIKEADEVKVQYNAVYGFPEQVSIDAIKQAVDDELGLTVSAFEALP